MTEHIVWHQSEVSKGMRADALKQKPFVLWYTGLSGSGKSTLANAVDCSLHQMGYHTYLLDGDNIRHALNKDLGFGVQHRVENIRRISEVAKLFTDAGLIVSTAFISPFIQERTMAREIVSADFIEVFVDTPLEICEQRDPKGLYQKARSGEIKNFTGIDSPYEPPQQPDLHLHTDQYALEVLVQHVLQFLKERGYISAR